MSRLPTENKAIIRHVDSMFKFLDNGNNAAVLKEYEKIDDKLKQCKNEETIAAHIIIKAICLSRTSKAAEAIQLVQSVQNIYEQIENLKNNKKISSKNNTTEAEAPKPEKSDEEAFQQQKSSKKKDKRNRYKANKAAQKNPETSGPVINRHGFPHIPNLYTDRQAIDCLSFFYANELSDCDLLMSHWEKANKHFPNNIEYKAQLFMAQVKCIEPTKMKNTALALYKNSMAKHESVRNEAQTSTYLCWATMSMLVEQAMADPDMNDEDCFTPIAKNPPPAKNKLLSTIAMKSLEKKFEESANKCIRTTSEARLYLMACEASGEYQNVIDMYQGEHKYLRSNKQEPKKTAESTSDTKIDEASKSPVKKDANNNTVMPIYPYRHDVIRCELYTQLKQYDDAESTAKEAIKNHGNDSWPFLLTLCMIASEDESRKAGVTSYVEELVQEEEAKTERRQRGPYLAQLELCDRFEPENSEKTVDLLQKYISKFATSIILFEDIDKYLSSMIDNQETRKAQLLNFIKNFNFSDIEDVKKQRRTETAMILLRYRLGDYTIISNETDESEFLEKYAKCLKDCPAEGPSMKEQSKISSSPQTAIMANPEPYVGDAYILVVVQSYLRQYHEGGNVDKALAWKSCVLLERLLDLSPANQHIRLILVMLYVWEFGAWDAGYALMKEVDIKHVQCETLGYMLTRWCNAMGKRDNAQIMRMQVLHFKNQSMYEAKENITHAFQGGVFDKVFEMMDYVRKMDRSMHARYCELELQFYHSLDKCEPLSQFRNDTGSWELQEEKNKSEVLTLEFKVEISDLSDSRDLGLFDDWKPDAIQRTKANQTKNGNETRAWISLRESISNLFMLLEKKRNSENHSEIFNERLELVRNNFAEGEALLEKGSAGVELPLKLGSEWNAACSMKYLCLVERVAVMSEKMKDFEGEDIGGIIASFDEYLTAYLEATVDAEVFNSQISGVEKAVFAHPEELEKLQLTIEMVTQLILNLESNMPETKNARKTLMKKSETFNKNFQNAQQILSTIDTSLQKFLNGLPKLSDVKLPKNCESYDQDYAEIVVSNKIRNNLKTNIQRWEKCVQAIRYRVSQLKLC